MEGFTKAAAIELGPFSVRVNTICRTFIETPRTRPFFADSDFLASVLMNIKLGRLGPLQDIMGAIVFPGERRIFPHDRLGPCPGGRVDGRLTVAARRPCSCMARGTTKSARLWADRNDLAMRESLSLLCLRMLSSSGAAGRRAIEQGRPESHEHGPRRNVDRDRRSDPNGRRTGAQGGSVPSDQRSLSVLAELRQQGVITAAGVGAEVNQVLIDLGDACSFVLPPIVSFAIALPSKRTWIAQVLAHLWAASAFRLSHSLARNRKRWRSCQNQRASLYRLPDHC